MHKSKENERLPALLSGGDRVGNALPLQPAASPGTYHREAPSVLGRRGQGPPGSPCCRYRGGELSNTESAGNRHPRPPRPRGPAGKGRPESPRIPVAPNAIPQAAAEADRCGEKT